MLPEESSANETAECEPIVGRSYKITTTTKSISNKINMEQKY